MNNDEENLLANLTCRHEMDIFETVGKTDWAKNITKVVTHVQMMMKEKGIDAPLDYTNLSLEREDEPLPPKYKFPNMKKYSGTDDPHLHLKQYVTYMKATELSEAQIIKQFSLSLKGVAVKWYYTLDAHVQQDWKELCSAFIKQYGLNAQFEVSLQDLLNTK